MEQLFISKTTSSPNVDFKENGKLSIEGRSFIEDPQKFFSPLLQWVKDLSTETVNLEIRLDYLNTSSTKMMAEFIKTIDANSKISNKVINWYFEEDDEDMIEVGQIIEENTFFSKFFFHETVESFSC